MLKFCTELGDSPNHSQELDAVLKTLILSRDLGPAAQTHIGLRNIVGFRGNKDIYDQRDKASPANTVRGSVLATPISEPI